jgi:hypothetical protein
MTADIIIVDGNDCRKMIVNIIILHIMTIYKMTEHAY